ncbi:DUF6586 family protein [Microbulbifer guangxiensis]|uniref:DUF6586 family protein n=1 Tax=Microbulbifer guangxiensis TaxID=2904249 RepID=UPI001F385DA9|nr:DUF6586 family protein [Microbulbifer guangxiensis]
MSNPYTGVVAAALRKSALLADIQAEGSLLSQAVDEARLLQLRRAYQAFLAELAFQLQLGSEPDSPAALARLAQAQNKGSGEAGELLALLEDPDSWLSRLESCWRGLWQFSSEPGDGRGAAKPVLIPARDLSRGSSEAPSGELLNQWQAALSEIIQRQRAHSAEW